MLLNYDFCDIFADIDLLCKIKRYDWPVLPKSLVYLGRERESKKHCVKLRDFIKADVEKGMIDVVLWFAINYRRLDPYLYVDDITFATLYNAGFTTDFTKINGLSLIRNTIIRDKPSIDILNIITSNRPSMFTFRFILSYAILKDRLDVVKWVFASGYNGCYMSRRCLENWYASDEVIEMYRERYGDHKLDTSDEADWSAYIDYN